ncbi:hypothetical protein BRADI_2g21874v3 [Brachypodium distachyon]|uniref:Uncharacterized protein n=1 Tax=Brachypodium distachyon TaxID=15368 RepID=A0A2K2D9S4_BRADI|nr:hypothetical protein BRADI_2g21874v3 [Brachypodium distachyon]
MFLYMLQKIHHFGTSCYISSWFIAIILLNQGIEKPDVNICCLSVQINYHGGDYLTLSDSYCSVMLVEQLVWYSGYVMLLQFRDTGEAPEDTVGRGGERGGEYRDAVGGREETHSGRGLMYGS